MNDVFYGTYVYSPAPIFTLEDEPIFIEGKLDYFKQNVSLIGYLTGCNIESLRVQRDEMVNAHATGFLHLTVGNTGFNYAKPVSINFSDSKLTKILPYEISFEAYQNTDFSAYYGILDPADEWTFSEEEERTFSATHKVSARAASIDNNSIERVKSFVSGRLNGYENLSLFLTGTTAVLSSVSETFNRINNTYSIEEQYSLSQFGQWDKSGAIIRPKASISYNEGGISINVNGNIKGGIQTPVSTGLFTPEDAFSFALTAAHNYLSPFETGFYSLNLRTPTTYSYDVNTGTNDINFNFQFGNPSSIITGDVRHEYTVSFNASKDQVPITVSLAGRVFYQGVNNPFIFGVAQEQQARWQAVEGYFSGVDPYLIVNEHFSYYLNGDLPYSRKPLNPVFESSNVDKNPFENIISYDFNFSNKKFISGLLNPSITINTDYAILVYSIKQTCDWSFSVQETYEKIKRVTVSVNSSIPTGSSAYETMIIASGWMKQYEPIKGVTVSESFITGERNIALSKVFAYE